MGILEGDESMRFTLISVCCLLLAVGLVFGQSTRGSITGTIVDPAKAVVPNATIEAENTETGAKHQAASSETGNYTLAELPAGKYQLTATVSGFKKYVQTGITVIGSQTLRIDVKLEVGQISETVSVQEDATLLRTETSELSHNISTKKMDELPVVGFNQWVRDPLAAARLIPGTNQTSMALFRVNGAPSFTQSMRIDGMETNNAVSTVSTKDSQPSVDALDEVTILTSNYAAEFGQAGGGVVNMTSKSGTNDYHGSTYLYWTNEKLNAALPYLPATQIQKPKNRVFVPGGNIGGPVYIPKLFDGHNKMFFFFNFEASRRVQMVNTSWTMPTDKMRNGDFSEAYTGKTLGKDDWGRTILEGQIYDPATTRVENGIAGYRDLFVNNQIPIARFDPVSLAIQTKYIPRATNQGALINNYLDPWPYPGHQNIPSAKLDWYLGPKTKISAYGGSFEGVARGGDDGIKTPLSNFRPTNTNSITLRVSLDQTLTPTMLLHTQLGWHGSVWPDYVEEFDQLKELGLKGSYSNRFPVIGGTASTTRGGLGTRLGAAAGPTTQSESHMERPEASVSFTWVKSNHTYKFGGEMRLDGFPTIMLDNSYGVYNFSTSQTGLPSTYGKSAQLAGGTVGFAYASFMMGLVDNGNIGIPSAVRQGKQSWAFFAQDSWKLTRKLTVDYGLRYDYQTYLRDTYGRIPNFSPSATNPVAGGLKGAMIFERNGVDFAKSYPYAFGPRLGMAYQVLPKTVIRAGFGIAYAQTANENRSSIGFGSNNPYSAATGSGNWATTLKDGPPAPGPWPVYDAGLFVTSGKAAQGVGAIDGNAGRPPRQSQWSLSLQREIFRNLAIEIAYVGNRGVWWPSSNLININALTPEYLRTKGLDVTVAADRTLLGSAMSSAAVVARGFTAPYSGFLMTQTLAQALRPYPQYGTITYRWSPLGKTWYDALQMKATKRFSHGFDITSTFTFAKELMMGAETDSGGGAVNDVFNRRTNKYLSTFSRPVVFMIAGNYRVPALKFNRVVSYIVSNWTFGAMMQYASGTPISAPASNNLLAATLFRGTYQNRVPGQPLFVLNSDKGVNTPVDLNCTTCYDPKRDFVLNPAAWSDAAPGTFGGVPYYNDYRSKRWPGESMNFERIFHVGERAKFSFRLDFTNIFNRINVPGPSSGNPASIQTRDKNGVPTGGFGFVNVANPSGSRQAQAVLRFSF
jgi:hypothetical protein